MILRSSLLVLALLAQASTSAFAGEQYLIAIGNNEGAKNEVTLRYAEADARRFADVLERLGGLPPQNIVQILGRDANDLRAALEDVDIRIGKTERDVSLLVYYSGHADASGLHLGSSVLEYDELKALVNKSSAKLKVLILDGCRSGGLTRVKGAKPAKPFAIQLDDRSAMEGLALISSSAAGEDSHESDKLRSSFFTHHFIGGLLGAADRNGDRKVVLSEAYAYAYENTLRSSQKTLNLQHPTRAFDIKGRGDFVMSNLNSKNSRSGLLFLAEAGHYLLMENDEKGPVVAELTTEEADTAVALDRGQYFVQHRLSDHYREYEVDLRANKTANLGQLKYEQVAYARLVRKGAMTHKTSHALFVGGGFESNFLEGFGLGQSLGLTYGLDVPWVTFGLRGAWVRHPSTSPSGDLADRGYEKFKMGLSAQRFLDFAGLSLGLGLVGDGIYHIQSLALNGSTEERTSWGLSFGALATLEAQLGAGIVMRIEGGPLTDVYLAAETKGGAQISSEITSELGWLSNASLGWRF